MASQAVGIAEGAIDLAVAYAKERVQFKKPISANQGIQWYFADIATSTEAAKMLTLQAADLRQRGPEYRQAGCQWPNIMHPKMLLQ